ncbi:23 kDa integral membrane protein-like [Neocloeon triangulifer]|uniref:23 kDa integral membrane protein-like n=1 Tax=Neocloeon triangulifer TaxID=2078957 RepID=UPI00286EE806|nr:23 kDa integral membrane protein-like [Neocloeon triangulifer]
MTSGIPVLKIVSLVLTVGTILSGFSIMGIGIQIRKDKSLDLEEDQKAVAISLIVAGTLTVLISLAGCCGIISESKPLLYIYAFFAFLLSAFMIITGIVVFACRKKWVDKGYNLAEKEFKTYSRGKNENGLWKLANKQTKKQNDTVKSVDAIQSELKCCQWNDKNKDWDDDQYPDSCKCSGIKDKCLQGLYQKKCAGVVKEHFSDFILCMGWLCIFMSIFPITIGCISCVIAKKHNGYENFKT